MNIETHIKDINHIKRKKLSLIGFHLQPYYNKIRKTQEKETQQKLQNQPEG